MSDSAPVLALIVCIVLYVISSYVATSFTSSSGVVQYAFHHLEKCCALAMKRTQFDMFEFRILFSVTFFQLKVALSQDMESVDCSQHI
jgi:hypothetical protein